MLDDDTPIFDEIRSRHINVDILDEQPTPPGQIRYAGHTDWFTSAPLGRIDGWCEDRDPAELSNLDGRE